MKKTDQITLENAVVGFRYVIDDISINSGSLLFRLYDFGIVNEATITPLFKSMFTGCTAYDVNGCVVSLRDSDANKIHVKRYIDKG